MNPYGDKVKIGKNFRVGDFSKIGALPLIFDRETGRRIRPEMHGGLEIGDNVDVGCSCVINIGEKRDTIIGNYVMIGHLTSIGHDVIILDNTGISAHVAVLGFVEIGEWSFVASQSVIQPYVKVGDYTLIGTMSNVTKDIPSGVIAWGNPCKVIKENTWRPKI